MIIGLSGYARSGKDEIAKVLIEEFGYTRYAFADKLRDILYDLNPNISGERLVPMVDTYGWTVAKTNHEVRELLQALGISARKNIYQDVWVDAVLRPLVRSDKVVITDVRFKNEYFAISGLPLVGSVWRVRREGVGPVNNHISEIDLDNESFDVVVDNNGSLEELRDKVRKVMSTDAD